MFRFKSDCWALILGGSSGFGLAAAQKLAAHGMNICIVHRDRRSVARSVAPVFETMRSEGVDVLTFNRDALSAKERETVLVELADHLGKRGRVKLILHSIAFGNLKLLAPNQPDHHAAETLERLAREINADPEALKRAIADIFDDHGDPLHALSRPTDYNSQNMLDREDFNRTIHAMGTSLVEWVQDVFDRRLFTDDARVLSLTSEGNATAWRGYAAVSAAKAALEAVSRSMALEFAPYGIRTNVIQAGVTETPALRAIPGHRRMLAQARLRNPSGRLTTPQDVANIVFLLCTDEAAWINGALVRADGGERIA